MLRDFRRELDHCNIQMRNHQRRLKRSSYFVGRNGHKQEHIVLEISKQKQCSKTHRKLT